MRSYCTRGGVREDAIVSKAMLFAALALKAMERSNDGILGIFHENATSSNSMEIGDFDN